MTRTHVADPENQAGTKTTDTDTTPPSNTAARLNVNINSETAEQLRRVAKERGISYTEAVRRAVAIWTFVEDEVRAGHKVQSVDPTKNVIRELVLM